MWYVVGSSAKTSFSPVALFHDVLLCRGPWPLACQSSVPWCHMAQAWHHSLSRTPTVYLYWRSNRDNSSSSNRHSRQTQVQHIESYPTFSSLRIMKWVHHLLFLKWVPFPFCLIYPDVFHSVLHGSFTNNRNRALFLKHLLFSRPCWNIRADPSALPLPDSNWLYHHSSARKHPTV